MTLRSAFLLLLLAMLALARPAHAAQGTAGCTGFITSVPTTISTPGTWCLSPGLGANSGLTPSITVASDKVTIDCNDYTFTATQAPSAVYAKDHFDVTVRNCVLDNFNKAAIDLEATTNTSGGRYVVENNRVTGRIATLIRVDGDGSVVRHNRINGGSSLGGSTNQTYGIYTTWSVDILDNLVTAMEVPNGDTDVSAYGIYTLNNASGSIAGNSITNLEPQLYGHMYGIHNENSGRITIRDNTVLGNGTAGGIGILCTGANSRAVHNVIAGFETGLSFCGDAGDNDVTP
ncbi:MAG TPA: right-handed parallel beta-helix repeat-containing protein [Xanthomonadaceae bacterium]